MRVNVRVCVCVDVCVLCILCLAVDLHLSDPLDSP